MKKIPVGAAIAHAYCFAFGEFLPLVKLLWLPLLAMLGFNLIAAPQIAVLSTGLTTHDFSALTMPWWLVLGLIAIAWIFSFMLITGVFQYALGQPEAQGRPFYCSFARPMWRLIGAFLLLALVMMVLVLLFILAVVVILFIFRLGLALSHISDHALTAIMGMDAALAFLAGYCGFIFCGLRFGFLLGAATIAEGRIGLFRSWTLSHGNFWRMFVISLALFLPFVILQGLLFYGMGIFPHIPAGASAEEIRALQQAASAAAMARMQHYWYAVYPVGAVVAILMYGLMAGSSVFAWRILTEGEPTPNPL